MFSWFKKRKTLEEKIAEVKHHAVIHQLTAHHANLMYFKIALEFGWRDAAEHFLAIHMKDELQIK